MGGLFGSSKPSPVLPPAPLAPVEEAVFKPGGDDGDKGRKKLKTLARGKKRLQIPLTTSGAKKAVNIGK